MDRITDRPDMTSAVDRGRKASTQKTNKIFVLLQIIISDRVCYKVAVKVRAFYSHLKAILDRMRFFFKITTLTSFLVNMQLMQGTLCK